MEKRGCVFYSSRIKLNWFDLLKLVLGATLEKDGMMVSFYRWADNKCPQCREADNE